MPFLDPSHAYVEAFPSIPREGMMVTFDRVRAISREDIRFVSPDHSLYWDAMDLLINSKSGTTAFCILESDSPNIYLEAVFVLEVVAQSRWHVEQFLAPTPVRILSDIAGNDFSEEITGEEITKDVEDGNIHRFLEQPGFDEALLKGMIEAANQVADQQVDELKTKARSVAETALQSEIQRLIDLRKINDHVRPEEIEHAQERLQHICEAIDQSRLRLDSIRLIVAGGHGRVYQSLCLVWCPKNSL